MMEPSELDDRRSWLVACAVVVATTLGGGAALVVGELSGQTGIVQPYGTYLLPQTLYTGTVTLLFGTPFAAFAAAVIAYFGLRQPRAAPYAIVGMGAGAVVYIAFGLASVSIGQWWITSVPSDTNRAAALFALILVPWGTVALLLATVGSWRVETSRGNTRVLHFLLSGVLLGLLLGSLVGAEASSITWALNCDPSQNCFVLSGVINSGAFVGGLEGAVLGAICGWAAWMVRLRGSSSGSADRPAPAQTGQPD